MKSLLKNTSRGLLLALLLVVAGCGDRAAQEETAEEPTETMTEVRRARATLIAMRGHTASGQVTFAQVEGGVRVTARIQGLDEGRHGFHIHEFGDCSAPDGSSAGGHFNPDGSPHGAPDAAAGQRHAGDLGNLEAGPRGMANVTRIDSLLTFDGPSSFVDKAVIIHAGADDFTSQPSGDAGPRVACGIIKADTGV